MAKPRFQTPKGTRDLYPEEMLRRRYLTGVWRDTSIRHGFEEIDGPTFETSDLYAVKSGDGILGELFQAFSGKSPEEVERVQKEGRAPFALRPEFTPTLARMYAARAAQLAKPTKWFSIGPFFRAERPQRGRLREFLQWNADILSGEETIKERWQREVDLLELAINGTRSFGLSQRDTAIHLSNRDELARILTQSVGVRHDLVSDVFSLLDKRGKLSEDEFDRRARDLFFDYERFDALAPAFRAADKDIAFWEQMRSMFVRTIDDQEIGHAPSELGSIAQYARSAMIDDWLVPDFSIVRGLAYYTGTVFEVIAEGERAVAGGGRYDNLIELLGGPPTPAVGFAMGDVVLSLLLEDKGLMPEGAELLDAASRPGASLRPEAFVITPDETLDADARRLLASLRRGTEREGFDGKPWAGDRYEVRPLHARRSYKSTRNIGKLVKDATGQHARTLVIIESGEHATVQHLDTKERLENIALGEVPARVAELTAR